MLLSRKNIFDGEMDLKLTHFVQEFQVTHLPINAFGQVTPWQSDAFSGAENEWFFWRKTCFSLS